MEFNKLRLLGFKSFVESTDFAIEKGLTGVVGPNGCGKSNLVEALRWVMGENSYKNMRASSMDEVIFAGSGNRPSRNVAEVALFLDNADRTAPAAFNDADELQVSRRIERESGSVYRINGKDVRAKDVQLLFADVSTGARSPSMIGQGRIGELISAKPQARRALLEEAAGISGLHSRRHEAELRLRAAETNLERLDDVVTQMETQLDSLKRQARQANRYRNIAGDIRKAEASILHLRWSAAKAATAEAEKAMTESTVSVGETQLVQTEAATAQALIANKLPELREAEAKAAAALQHVIIARNQLDEEAKRIEMRKQEMQRRAAQLEEDIKREEQMVAENSDIIAHLEREDKQLTSETDTRADKESATKAKLESVSLNLSESERVLTDLTQELALNRAQANQTERALQEGGKRKSRLQDQIATVANELQELSSKIGSEAGVQDKLEIVSALEASILAAETVSISAEKIAESAREAEQSGRAPVSDAQAALNQIETEAKTLARVISSVGNDLFPAVLEHIRAENGFEKALGAALGEDLDVPLDASSPAHWVHANGDGDHSLPSGVKRLSDHVSAPKELSRRLAQIGVVTKSEGDKLCDILLPGQRLVTKDGDLWRWDGYRASAEAPTAAALKLEQKNRLAELDAAAVQATKDLRTAESAFETTRKTAITARDNERESRDLFRSQQNQLGDARKALSEAERSVSEMSNRRSALEEAKVRLTSSLDEVEEVVKEADTARAALPDFDVLNQKTQSAGAVTAQHRAAVAEASAEFESLARENSMRVERLEAIAREREAWNERAVNANRQIKILRDRLAEAVAQKDEIEAAPDEIENRRREMIDKIDAAEANRKEAADFLTSVENDQREADKLAIGRVECIIRRQTNSRPCRRVFASRKRKTV